MMNRKDIPQADQSWAAAEKMLNRHFRNKRIMLWSLSVLIPAVMVGLTLMITHFNKSEKMNDGKSVHAGEAVSQPGLSNSVHNDNNDKNVNTLIENKSIINNKNNQLNTTGNKKSQPSEDINQNNKNGFNSPGIVKNGQSNAAMAASVNAVKTVKPVSVGAIPMTSAAAGNSSSGVHSGKKSDPKTVLSGSSVLAAGSESQSGGFYPAENFSAGAKETFSLLSPSRKSLPTEASIYSVHENRFPVPAGKSTYNHVVWEIGAYGGAHYIQKTLSGDSEWNNYLMHRENEEEPIVAPSIGLSITANLKSLSISAGIEYSVYGEETNYYPYSNQLQIDDNSVWQSFLTNFVDTDTAYIWGNTRFFETVRQRSDSIFVFDQDTSEVYKYDENIAKNNGVNHIYYVEIPIQVAYTLNKGRMGFGVVGGVSPAFLTGKKGYYLRQDGRGIESLEEIESFRKFLINARVGVDVYYRAGARTKLMLRPLFKANLNSVFEDDYGVKQKYYSTGILFGITYMLN